MVEEHNKETDHYIRFSRTKFAYEILNNHNYRKCVCLLFTGVKSYYGLPTFGISFEFCFFVFCFFSLALFQFAGFSQINILVKSLEWTKT